MYVQGVDVRVEGFNGNALEDVVCLVHNEENVVRNLLVLSVDVVPFSLVKVGDAPFVNRVVTKRKIDVGANVRMEELNQTDGSGNKIILVVLTIAI